MRLHPARPKPARQPEAVATSFEGQCNPRDLAAGLDRLKVADPLRAGFYGIVVVDTGPIGRAIAESWSRSGG